MPNFFSLFKTKETVLANREPSAKGTGKGGVAEKTVKTKTPNDPVASLTLEKIDTTYRREIEQRGLYLNASYALAQMAKLVPPLAEVINFWASQISTLDWSVNIIEGSDETKAERQKKVVLERFNQFANLKKALKALALFRFNGFSACKVSENSLAIVNPWSVVQNVSWTAGTPDFGYYLNAEGLYSPDFSKLEPIVSPGYVLVESDQSILLALLRLALKYRESDDAWDKNLSNSGRNQIIIRTPPQSTLTDAQKTNLENLLISISEGNSGWLEEIDSSNPIKIDRIEACPALNLYKDRLATIRTDIISLVASSTLNNQTGATGLGSNVATSHATTLQTLCHTDAGTISESLDQSITIPALQNAGLIGEGETPLVYFTLSQRKSNDASAALDLAVKARQAGRDIEDSELAEMTGLSLVPYTPSAPVASASPYGSILNAEPAQAQSPSAYLSKEELAGIDANLLKAIEHLAEKQMGDNGDQPVTEEWISSLQEAIKKLPLDLVDVSAIEDKLTELMTKEVKVALAKKTAKVIKNRKTKGA